MFRSNLVGPYNDFPLLLSPQTVSLRVFSLPLSDSRSLPDLGTSLSECSLSQTRELLSQSLLSQSLLSPQEVL